MADPIEDDTTFFKAVLLVVWSLVIIALVSYIAKAETASVEVYVMLGAALFMFFFILMFCRRFRTWLKIH